jgi:cytochrome c-type biogenesis protein CcmH
MTLWILFGGMSLAAVAFVILPLLRGGGGGRAYAVTAITALAVVGLSAGIYAMNGRPGVPSGANAQPNVSEMVNSLAARLEEQPDDLAGWMMLGRSYMVLERFEEAAAAFEKAAALEDPPSAGTLVNLGAALARANEGQEMPPRAVAAFENALALQPNHPEALFWGGIGAVTRGDTELAAERWEALLATNPPANVQEVLRARIAEWRGEPAPVAPAAAPADTDGAVVTVRIDLSSEARAALPEEASVFVIARDPAQPSPPIAVTRRRLSELPASVELGDRDAMMPGRNLSAFDEFELVVRASASGTPAATPGDWFGSRIVQPATGSDVSVQIGERVE